DFARSPYRPRPEPRSPPHRAARRHKVPGSLFAARMTSTPRSHHRDVGSVDRFHADDVIAAIDMMDFAADTGGEVAQQIKAGAADILDGDVTLQGRVQSVPLENIIEVADAPGGERIDRTGGNRVDADIVAAHF